MKFSTPVISLIVFVIIPVFGSPVIADEVIGDYTLQSGHSSLQEWLLPDVPPYPDDNEPNSHRVALGKMLFFDPRLSGDGNISCATCHNPMLGWSDGQALSLGSKGKVLKRASPTITNTAFNTIQMWDGRNKTLEEQAIGPLESDVEMNMDFKSLFIWLRNNGQYSAAFDLAYPEQEINKDTLSKAIASFERTIISNNSPFDRWIKGDQKAMTAQQIRGFKVFLDEEKGNCVACHQAPNFTDNGFHNLGLTSYKDESPDLGRYEHKPIGLMKGAFKTPTLRDVANTAPYFHDGSSENLTQVMEHYTSGGLVKDNVSPNMKSLDLTKQEIAELVEFMHALTSYPQMLVLPTIPSGSVAAVQRHDVTTDKNKLTSISE
ncbi:MAG: cytochrome-c peroxidase [Gammaproteobacteria bacterium]